MLNKILNNKKIAIPSIISILLVLVILLVTCGRDEQAGTESESNGGVKQEETYDGDGLEVNENDEKTENSVDTSGYWEDAEDTGNSTDNITTSQPVEDKTEGTVNGETENNVEDKNEEPEYDNNVSQEDTLDDGTSWGAIY